MRSSSLTAYDVLHVSEYATCDDIERKYVELGYSNSLDKEKFRQLAIAFLVLTTDRNEYDVSLRNTSMTSEYQVPTCIWNCNPDEVYEAVFNRLAVTVEDSFKDSSESEKSPFNAIIGSISGGVFGFMVAGPVGAVGFAIAGAAAGNVRDTHGKNCYEVFKSMKKEDQQKIIQGISLGVMLLGKAHGF
ncbi:hypothetical protein BCR33DRAFT_849733 [Rhizoclosmatium globosum]|uniref:J domain-containing protein n=1 Tax=Rhizoclosmatium globosum TaxID=329046 RepID=A0A1Y2CGH3_9FUNG|nr:hypothetical protein BCR33DRAFT_849733 [Rhizoclosmatium globosum]|eukprot:ORY46140.1 hypothetical protein BCR33DRAFT_849733 [Rhizoclosmatium globosum]